MTTGCAALLEPGVTTGCAALLEPRDEALCLDRKRCMIRTKRSGHDYDPLETNVCNYFDVMMFWCHLALSSLALASLAVANFASANLA